MRCSKYVHIKPTLCEEIRIPVNQLAAHCRRCQLEQSISLVALACVDRNLLDLVDRHRARSPQTLDDGLTAHTLLHVLLDLLQNLACQHHHRCCSVANLCILRSCDVCQDACGRVYNVEELHDSRAVICDRLSAILVD